MFDTVRGMWFLVRGIQLFMGGDDVLLGDAPDLWTEALTRMLTPPMPSRGTSLCGSLCRSPIQFRVRRCMLYSL